MPHGSTRTIRAPMRVAATTIAVVGLAATACTQPRPPVPGPTTTAPGTPGTTGTGGTTTTRPGAPAPVPPPPDPRGGSTFDTTRIHDLSVTFEQADYDAMIAEFVATGEKEWMRADVVIDGTSYPDVGLRLKGNSSLMSLRRPGGGGGGGFPGTGGGATLETPEKLPWLLKLNEYVKGQKHEGRDELVVRSNPTQTSLNEAVSLELLARTGLAYQLSASYKVTVNGKRSALRLITEHPGPEWDDDQFDTPGLLYKAQAGGSYAYRGDDPAAYDDVFKQEGKGDDNFEPLIDFLRFINESTDAAFAAELPDRLDTEAFAMYLAFEDLIGNWDDIEGPGNNSYLRWHEETNRFEIVAWDHNLAMNAMSMPSFPGFPRPPAGGGFPGGGNVLVRRYKAVPQFNALYDAAMTRLRAELFTSGTAQQILDRRADVLRQHATDLVPLTTINTEAERVATVFRPR